MRKFSTVTAGIDTGKHKLDVAIHGRKDSLQVSNDAEGHLRLSLWLGKHEVERVGIEASGGYERDVIAKLREDGFVIVHLQPKQVRAYAQFRLQRAKNDKIDARLIATCAAEVQTVREAPDPRLGPLGDHLTLIEQIEEDIARCKTRIEAAHAPQILRRLQRELIRLKAWRALELKNLLVALRRHPDLARRLALAVSVDGVAERTGLAFVIRAPELGSIDREAAAALVGLAPFDDDSGDRKGQRHIDGGRARLRKSVYAAAFPAAFHWNPQLIAFYGRLTSNGKPHKVALVACARKLVTYVNTVLARGTEWAPKPARP